MTSVSARGTEKDGGASGLHRARAGNLGMRCARGRARAVRALLALYVRPGHDGCTAATERRNGEQGRLRPTTIYVHEGQEKRRRRLLTTGCAGVVVHGSTKRKKNATPWRGGRRRGRDDDAEANPGSSGSNSSSWRRLRALGRRRCRWRGRSAATVDEFGAPAPRIHGGREEMSESCGARERN